MTIEKYLQYFNYVYGIDYTILRYSNPYGERQNPYGKQGVIPIFLNKIKQGEQPVIYGDGSMIRDYIYIKDAVDATIAALEKKTNDRIFNIGCGKGTSLNELIDIMSEVVGQKVAPVYIKSSGIYISKVVLDISLVKKEIGWEPKTDLRSGIQKLWDYMLSEES